MSAASRVLRSEWAKVTTLKTWWIIALTLVGYIAFITAIIALTFGPVGAEASGIQLGDRGTVLVVYSVATTIGYVFPVLLGALAASGEFRSGQLTPTFLATPKRGRVLVAKVVVLVVFGVLLGVLGALASVGTGAAILAAGGADPLLADAEVQAMILRMVGALALWSAIGVGLGALVTSQVAVIVIVLVFTQFVEPILRLVAGVWEWSAELGKFLPGAATDAFVGAGLFTQMGALGVPGATAAPVLEWWVGGLVLVGYAVVLTFAAYLTSWRRDVS